MAQLNGSAPAIRRVVEIVGPAGCGKSTLLKAIAEGQPRLRTDLSLWGQPRWRLAAAALSLAPLYAWSLLERAPLRPGEFVQMARVDALLRRVKRALRRTNEVLLLDEGPLFALAWLEVFHRGLPGRSRRRWRMRSRLAWGALLGGVVHLDAATDVLASRIRRRRKSHPVKGAPDAEIERFTESFRTAFAALLQCLTLRFAIPVVHRRTDVGDRSSLRDALPPVLMRSAGRG